MTKFTAKDLRSGLADVNSLNENFSNLETFSDTVLSRDGTPPNGMLSVLDMNANSIINADTVFADDIVIDGISLEEQVQLAKDWAQKTDGIVDSTDFSSKEYAIGTQVPAGSSKDWAINPEDVTVDGSNFSAFHFAQKAEAQFNEASANEDIVLTSGQTIVNFTLFDLSGSAFYVIGVDVDSGRLATPQDYLITGPKQVTLSDSYPAGTILKAAIVNTAETGAADVAIANAGFAEEWANLPEDQFISVAAGGDQIDDFSSLHFSKKAEIFANIAGGSANEDVVLTSGQTLVTFSNFDLFGTAFFVIGDNVDSGRLTSPQDYTVASSTTVQLTNSYPAGTVLKSAVSETAETGAIESATLKVGFAEEWANKAEDTLISAAAGGDQIDDFSALHFSKKAEGFADAAGDIAGDIASQQITYVVKTTNFSPINGQAIAADTTSAIITLTLPASPVPGNVIRVLDYAGTFATNNCIMARNGSNIQGLAEDMNLNTNFISVSFTFVDATQGWKLT